VSGRLHFVVPGPLDQRTGGYLYDARMVEGLRARGWDLVVHNLEGRFPDPDDLAKRSLAGALEHIPDGDLVVLDGLAMGGSPETIREHSGRLRLLSLVHHPLADETGLSPAQRDHLVASERSALAPCTGVIVTSEYTAQHLASYGVERRRLRAVPPGTAPAPQARGPDNGEPPHILCVATVTPRKGHDVLVEALHRIQDLPWTCVCAGSTDRDPDHANRVLDLVDRYGLASRIDFVGEHDAASLDDLYAEASLFALASHYEGYGMALAEALTRGLPVVSTTGGAIPYTVPSDAGMLVPPGDPSAFGRALRVLVQPDGDELAKLASAARRHGESLPDWEASVDAFERAILELGAAAAA
jgi:glycosyltransferase involved in cell wall biosynthesis